MRLPQPRKSRGGSELNGRSSENEIAIGSHGSQAESRNGEEVITLGFGNRICRRTGRSGDNISKSWKLVLEILAWEKELLEVLGVDVSSEGVRK